VGAQGDNREQAEARNAVARAQVSEIIGDDPYADGVILAHADDPIHLGDVAVGQGDDHLVDGIALQQLGKLIDRPEMLAAESR